MGGQHLVVALLVLAGQVAEAILQQRLMQIQEVLILGEVAEVVLEVQVQRLQETEAQAAPV